MLVPASKKVGNTFHMAVSSDYFVLQYILNLFNRHYCNVPIDLYTYSVLFTFCANSIFFKILSHSLKMFCFMTSVVAFFFFFNALHECIFLYV